MEKLDKSPEKDSLITLPLLEGERIDDLQYKGLKIIQNKNKYCFCSDAVELANFVSGGSKDRAVDIGSGSGIIALLLAKKKGIKTDAVEIQPDMALMAQKSVKLNGLEDMITVRNMPIQEAEGVLEREGYSIVVCNPPYRKRESGMQQQNDCIRNSRHENLVTLQEIISAAAFLLKNGGRFYIVHMCERMAEVISLASALKLEPKVLQILTPDEAKSPHIFMLKCIKNAKKGLIVNKPRSVLPFDT